VLFAALTAPYIAPYDPNEIHATDRLVPPEHTIALHRHWDEPEILWYPGAHLSFRFHRSVRDFVDGALRRTVLAGR